MSVDPEVRRKEYLATLAQVFVELGYRGATTAILAERVGVRENVLYRVWPTKRDMFVAAVDYMFQVTHQTWQRVLAELGEGQDPVRAILAHQVQDHGKLRLYRLVYAGLLEDDPLIRAALQAAYLRFQALIVGLLSSSISQKRGGQSQLTPEEIAWGLIGLGGVVDVQRELDLVPREERAKLFETVAARLLA